MDYLSTVRILDTDYKLRDEEAARINHTHKIAEIEDMPSGLPTSEKLVPSGGYAGQVLAKSSASDYDVSWQDQKAGMTCEKIFAGDYSSTHNKSISCTKAPSEFDFIDVQYQDNDGVCGCVRIYGANSGTLFVCQTSLFNGWFFVKTKTFKIDGSTINTWQNNEKYTTGQFTFNGTGCSISNGDYIGITGVWGWKSD